MARRAYRSPLRAASSAATRERILDAAQQCFEQQGFAGTTMRAVAARAGVSVESVNLAGTKRALLIAALSRATSQVESDARILDLPEPRALFAVKDPVVALSNLIAWIAASNLRVSRLWRAFEQAAETDADISADYADSLTRMRAESSRAVRELARRGALRTDLAEPELADLLWLTALPDQHRRLCDQAGWTQQRYQQWLIWAVTTALLAPHLIGHAKATTFPSQDTLCPFPHVI